MRLIAHAITCKWSCDELGRHCDCENGKKHPEYNSCENRKKQLSERVKDIHGWCPASEIIERASRGGRTDVVIRQARFLPSVRMHFRGTAASACFSPPQIPHHQPNAATPPCCRGPLKEQRRYEQDDAPAIGGRGGNSSANAPVQTLLRGAKPASRWAPAMATRCTKTT